MKIRKYQFCIRFNNIDRNSAANKAVEDCTRILSSHNYADYGISVGDNFNKLRYYFLLLRKLLIFFLTIRPKSLICIQYPLLSINPVFKFFIKLSKGKSVRFYCIVHDLESLRKGGKDGGLIKAEIRNLNAYNIIIAHNDVMSAWLKTNGVTRKIVSLELFDYLCGAPVPVNGSNPERTIVYAGNLNKSNFIYSLSQIPEWNFNVYGPNFKNDFNKRENLHWQGEYSPEHISVVLSGSYGLLWDGEDIDKCDEVLGNYLAYNNPHKCSLYIAAGLPLIAPKDTAIGAFVQRMNIGVLVGSLYELKALSVGPAHYALMKKNIAELQEKVRNGVFFSQVITFIENSYARP
jgi:hypothetical protein